MAEFDEEDLRPFSSTSRPRTSAPGPRPATGLRPKTGYRMGTAVGQRVDALFAVWSLTRVMLY